MKNYSNAEFTKLKNELTMGYYKDIYPKVKPLEKYRLVCLGLCIFCWLVFIVIAIYILPNILKVVYNPQDTKAICLEMLFFGTPVLLIFTLITKGIRNKYEKSVKKYYNEFAQIVGLRWVQGDRSSIPSDITNSKLFPPANVIEYDDIFAGEYSGVGLRITESKIIYSGYTEGNTSVKGTPLTLFSGVIVSFKSNKNIPCTTLIKSKYSFYHFKMLFNYFPVLFWEIVGGLIAILSVYYMFAEKNFFDYIGQFFIGLVFCLAFGGWAIYDCFVRNAVHNKDLQKIELEDVNLAKHYNAYSYSQIEGRYLLTTAFIDRFMEVSKVYKTNNLMCSYVNNNFVLAIPSKKNLFEIGNLFVSLNNPRHVESFISEIASIVVLVDYFKLDTNTKL